MKTGVELVTIGTELLLGAVDGNTAWLGAELARHGVRLVRHTTVPDDVDAIRNAVGDALERTGTVLCTGGLGPTGDDLTRTAIAALYNRRLIVDARWLDVLRHRFAERGMVMPEVNRVQAEAPEGARLLPNERGTAPGLIVEDARRGAVVLLPGVPREMRALVRDHVVHWLVRRVGAAHPIVTRGVRTTGISESALAERVAGLEERVKPLTVAFLPTPAGVDVRLTTWGELPVDAAEAALERALDLFEERIGRHAYGRDDDDLAERVGRILRARGLTLAVAESCTGGLLAARITAVPGSSDYFLAGYVAYANQAKVSLLGVRAETIERFGAVSEETVEEMTEGARRRAGAECAIAVTGIAGPGGGSAEKPVGTVWIAAAVREPVRAKRLQLIGGRNEIRERAAQAGLALLHRELEEGM